MPYLPYEEPGITTILSLTSFLLLLNGVRYALDRLLYCGIIGEIFIGMIWGLPVGGTAWLSKGAQGVIQAFGYLGLIGLVFEGGLTTDIALLRKNAYASVSVATIGLLMPIALSFLLLVFPFSDSTGKTAYPTPLAAFSAGASLCSTSLGTTFAILSAANMQKTRVGIVLVGAAMMDDVVGLVMVNIITTLGRGGNTGWPIARPIAASFGLLLATLVVCPYVLMPVSCWFLGVMSGEAPLDGQQTSKAKICTVVTKLIRNIPHLDFIISTLILIAFVTIASFIDASVLFAAFIAGGMVSFLLNVDSEQQQSDTTSQGKGPAEMYQDYLKPTMDGILVPFFFASIGFSIPITDMFSGSIVWKGIVYSILMVLAKGTISIVFYFEYFMKQRKVKKSIMRSPARTLPCQSDPVQMIAASALPPGNLTPNASPDAELSPGPPHSMALLAGMAMVARGEIGFLIASLSQSSGVLALRYKENMTIESSGEELFLVIVWAVGICTIVGPLGVGLIIRRIRP
ncbi:hypothetical protein D0Z07_2055 [Hyphodiscus hymeniophilus]|uniref:Cation/H+ exchanger transmembrane domain-containing protein n=1 Tax=Hyphodiscus hymeniophilus TaxID=353542 RepID=A0A9P6VPT1_9HELO|nr:hypothetical protein D0Z07_2055 [Hyphodiscus hymeniophilus]